MLRMLSVFRARNSINLQMLRILSVIRAGNSINLQFLRTLVGLCAIFVNKSNQMHTIHTKWAYAAI